MSSESSVRDFGKCAGVSMRQRMWRLNWTSTTEIGFCSTEAGTSQSTTARGAWGEQTAATTVATLPEPAERTRLVLPRERVDPGADAMRSHHSWLP